MFLFLVPKTELIGDQSRYVKASSKVALHCIVRGTIEPPAYIIWYRGKTQIMDDNKIGWYTQIDRNIFGNSSDQQNTVRVCTLKEKLVYLKYLNSLFSLLVYYCYLRLVH